jgi:hypothetical protein
MSGRYDMKINNVLIHIILLSGLEKDIVQIIGVL